MGRTLVILVSGAVAASMLGLDAAQAAGDQGLEEVTVTAEKRSEDVQKIPIAVTAEEGQTLVDQGITDVRGLGQLVPGIILGQDFVFTQIDIRGVGTNNDSQALDPAIAFNIDGVYQARDLGTFGSFFDIDHVEVLRGPQGTLYGRNATGGSINLITNKPADHYEADAELDLGNYSSVRGFGMVNVPVTDDFYVRAAVQTENHDGYLTSGFNDQDSVGARLQALYKPNSDFSLLVGGDYFHDGGIGANTILGLPYTDPSNPWFDATPHKGTTFDGSPVSFFQDFRSWSVHGQLDWTIGDVTLTDIPAFKDVTTSGTGPVVGVYNATTSVDKSFSNELRLASSDAAPSRLKWVAGLYYFNETDYVNSTYYDNCAPFVFCFSSNTLNPDIAETSGAAFGEATYSVLDWARVTGGVRYSVDNKSANGQSLTMGEFQPFENTPFPTGPAIPDNFNQTYHHIDWKIRVDADITPDNLVYASVTTGYLEGGFNLGSSVGYLPNFAPEELTSYAVGSKNKFFENHLQLNAEAFYYDYKNYIVTEYLVAPPFTGDFAEFNAAKTRIYGGEIEAEGLITENDRLNGNLALMQANFTNFDIPLARLTNPNGNGTTNFAGYQVMRAPYLTAAAGYSHTWDFADAGSLEFGVQTHFSAGYWTLFDHTTGTRQPGYTKTNLTLTYASESGAYRVQLYAENIENTAVIATEALPSTGSTIPWAHAEPPQTFGARISAHFDIPRTSPPLAPPPTPAPEPQAAAPVAPAPEAQRSFQVFFDFDKSDITDAASRVIQAAADAVKAGHIVQIVVTGHTDTVGTARYNQALSERRAASVKAGLVSDGVTSGEITTIGVGKTGLLVPTADGVREPQNRRAEIVLK